MLADGVYTGVVERFEEDATGTELAVILVEQDGEVVDQQDLPWWELPEDVGQDAVLEVIIVDGSVTDLRYDPEETTARRDAAQDRFDRLAERPPERSETEDDNS